jgi:hypothetical protein
MADWKRETGFLTVLAGDECSQRCSLGGGVVRLEVEYSTSQGWHTTVNFANLYASTQEEGRFFKTVEEAKTVAEQLARQGLARALAELPPIPAPGDEVTTTNNAKPQISDLTSMVTSAYVDILEARWRLDHEDDRNIYIEATSNAVEKAEPHLVSALKLLGVQVEQLKATALVGLGKDD